MLETVVWVIPSRVIVARFTGLLTLQDFLKARQTFQTLIPDTHPQPFFTLYDTSARTGLEWQLADLSYVRSAGFTHPRLRGLIVVDARPHPLASVVGRMAVHLARLPLHIVPTLPAALACAQNLDPFLRVAASDLERAASPVPHG